MTTSTPAPLDTDDGPARPGRRRTRLIAAGVVVVLLAGLAVAGGLWWRNRLPPVQEVPTQAEVVHTWPSGVWLGGRWSAADLAAFGAWRGSPPELATMYPAYATWQEIASSDWHVSTFDGFPGTLVYGLPLLPKADGAGTLSGVASGTFDDAFLGVAKALKDHGREDSYVRIGLEANGDWFPWGVQKAGNDAESFKAAFRHVAQLLKRELPQVRIVFDITCGHPIRGQSDRLASLTTLYPGDDVVDVVGCDHYDQHSTISRNASMFEKASLRPANAAGLQDVVEFAVQHGKKFAVPEWGVVATDDDGGGDNPYYIYAMYQFFKANAAHLAFENYFDEPDDYLGSTLFVRQGASGTDSPQNPQAAAAYRRLWAERS